MRTPGLPYWVPTPIHPSTISAYARPGAPELCGPAEVADLPGPRRPPLVWLKLARVHQLELGQPVLRRSHVGAQLARRPPEAPGRDQRPPAAPALGVGAAEDLQADRHQPAAGPLGWRFGGQAGRAEHGLEHRRVPRQACDSVDARAVHPGSYRAPVERP